MEPLWVKDRVLICPQCRNAEVLSFEIDSLSVVTATCSACGFVLPIADGIPDFARHIPIQTSKDNVSLIQRLNNSRFFSFYYDKPVWRPFLTRIGSWLSMAEETEIILKYAALQDRLTMADLACGTGRYSRAFAQRCPGGQVYGVDLSLNMLRQARMEMQRDGLPNITLLRGDIYRLPFADGSMDRVNCCGVLHLFADTQPIWREIARVLAPRGIFTGWVLTYAPNAFSKIQERLRDRIFLHLFRPEQLSRDLEQAGINRFEHEQHHLWLLIKAMKRG